MVLCSAPVATTKLIACWCSHVAELCWRLSRVLSEARRLGVGKSCGGGTARTADLNPPKGYSTPYNDTFWGEERALVLRALYPQSAAMLIEVLLSSTWLKVACFCAAFAACFLFSLQLNWSQPLSLYFPHHIFFLPSSVEEEEWESDVVKAISVKPWRGGAPAGMLCPLSLAVCHLYAAAFTSYSKNFKGFC